MARIQRWPGLQGGESAWEGFNPGDVIIQGFCPDCDLGLIYEPVRFCGRCHGAGLITLRTEHKHQLKFAGATWITLYDYRGVMDDLPTHVYHWTCDFCDQNMYAPVDLFWLIPAVPA